MKKILCIMSVLLVSLLSGQTEKGRVIIGGGLGFSGNKSTRTPTNMSNNGTESKANSFNLNLNGGYFITNNFAAGISFVYSLYQSESVTKGSNSRYTNVTKLADMTPGIFLRCYKMSGEKFGLFGHLNLGYQIGTTTYNSETENNGIINKSPEQLDKDGGINVSLSPGIVYFVTNRLGLEFRYGNLYYTSSVGTRSMDGNKTEDSNSGDYGLNLSISSLSIGASLYFGGGKNAKPAEK